MATSYVVCGSLSEAFASLNEAKSLAVDTETIGFYGKIRLVQLFQRGLDAVRIVENPNPLELFAYINKYHVVMHNAHYDITTIQEQTSTRVVPTLFEDTFLLARLHFTRAEKFSLDDVMEYVLGYDPYEKQGLNKKELQASDWSKPYLSAQQYCYAATDVFYLLDVYDVVKCQAGTTSYKLDILTLKYCLDFQWNGMPLDKDKIVEVRADIEQQLKANPMPINVNSWQQVRKYVGCTESDALALMTLWLVHGNAKAKAVLDTRKRLKRLSFLEKFDLSDTRIFGKFLPSARSGRLTSKDQNLQQLPRSLKKLFGVANDRVLIYADYAQIELRTICAITDCKKMEALFRAGEDLHGYTAAMLFGPDWDDEQRQISKTCNFNLLYGGGVPMLLSILISTAEIVLEEKLGFEIRKKWRNLWSEIFGWQERGIQAWKKGKLGSTPFGRQYLAKMMTDQLNIENQGAAAEVFKLALHYFLRESLPDDVIICNVIHDSFIIEAPNDPEVYQAVSIKLAKAMQLAWFEMSKRLAIKDLPMPVDIKVGFNWGELEDKKVDKLWSYSLPPYEMLGA